MFDIMKPGRTGLSRGGSGALALGGILMLAACTGGKSGKGSEGQNTGERLTDPVITVVGPTGTYSMTPQEANDANGASPPPLMPPQTPPGVNQYIRLEVPFTVNRSSLVSPDPLLSPFSQLNGNLSIRDEAGNHLPGIVIVNGIDAFGIDRRGDVGFPSDLSASGSDLNVGPGVILYVADTGDGNLATAAAFGGSSSDTDGLPTTTDIRQMRITLNNMNGFPINGFYTVNVGTSSTPDNVNPTVLSVTRTFPSSADPMNPGTADPDTQFIVRFSEPVVPRSVGNSARFDLPPFRGNLPLLGFPGAPPSPPLPPFHITSVLNQANNQLFIPCDVNPLNSNNLATYVIRPLIALPTGASVTTTVVDASLNIDPATQLPVGAMDLSGRSHQPGVARTDTFTIGPGRNLVNAPVSPQAMYWLPNSGRGLGVVDLNGLGFNTNTPGANAGDYRRAAIVTKPWLVVSTVLVQGYNIFGARALEGFPSGGRTPNPPNVPPNNAFRYRVGLGGYTYGPGLPGKTWLDADTTNLGNPGTPIPGVNEMSSGFETMVRDSAGDVILTGRQNEEIGRIGDVVVGEFLDITIFDTLNNNFQPTNHQSFYWRQTVMESNGISDPPSPNPPPLRYWVGLEPVDVLIDQSSPTPGARLIEGEEVWAGDKLVFSAPFVSSQPSFQWLLPNQTSQTGADVLPTGWAPGGLGLGPSPQSATVQLPYTSRQQIGNYLYVTDTENKQLHALNSNTFQTIMTMDLPDPNGLAIHPNSRYLFVSNSGDDSVSVIGASPTQPDFHTEVARVPVGRSPRALCVQPDAEDVLVCNFLGNSVSVIEMGSLTVRKTIENLIAAPLDVVASPRDNAVGWVSAVYLAYIANLGANSLVAYESGPDGPQGFGCNDILGSLPTPESDIQVDFFEPRGLIFSPYRNDAGLLAGGCFVAHRDNQGVGMVSHIQFTHQVIPGPQFCVLPPGGNFIIPPGFNEKEIEVVAIWGGSQSSRLLGNQPTFACLADFNNKMFNNATVFSAQAPNNAFRGFPVGGNQNTRYPWRFLPQSDLRFPEVAVAAQEADRLYVSFADSDVIQVLDPLRSGRVLGSVEPAGVGVRRLATYFSQ